VCPVKYELGSYIPEDGVLHGSFAFRLRNAADIMQFCSVISSPTSSDELCLITNAYD
jgi:hypothetical protein